MSHSCFHQTSDVIHGFLLDLKKNIATCLKEIPETGGAALETTVMTSPHLADFIFEETVPEYTKCTWLFCGMSIVYDQSSPCEPTGTTPDNKMQSALSVQYRNVMESNLFCFM